MDRVRGRKTWVKEKGGSVFSEGKKNLPGLFIPELGSKIFCLDPLGHLSQLGAGLGLWKGWSSFIPGHPLESAVPLHCSVQRGSHRALGIRSNEKEILSTPRSLRGDSPCHCREQSASQSHGSGIHQTCRGTPLSFSGHGESSQGHCQGRPPARDVPPPKCAFVLLFRSCRPLRPCHVAPETHTSLHVLLQGTTEPCLDTVPECGQERLRDRTGETGAPGSSPPQQSREEHVREASQTRAHALPRVLVKPSPCSSWAQAPNMVGKA